MWPSLADRTWLAVVYRRLGLARVHIRTVQDLALEGLEPASLVLSVLYLGFAVAHLTLPVLLARVLAPTALVSSLGLAGLHVALRRRAERRLNPHLLAGAVAALVLLNSLLHLALTGDPVQTTNLMMLLVGAGFLLLSPPLLVGLIAVTFLGWLGVAQVAAGGGAWRHFGFGLLSSAALGLILQITRLHSYGRLEALRAEAEAQAQMLRQRAAHLEALIAVGHSINGFLDLDALLTHVVDTLNTRFDYEYAGIFLVDQQGDTLIARAGTGQIGRDLVAQGCRLEVGKRGLVGWASRHRESVCVNDVARDERYHRVDILADTRSEFVLPLEADGRLLGILDIQSRKVGAFSAEDRRVCLSLADQVAIAIVNASRYELEHTRRLLSETLITVGRALAQTLDVSEVLDLILDNLGRIVQFDRGAVMLEREGVLEAVAAQGYPPGSHPLEIRLPIRADDPFDRITRTKAPLAITEVAELTDWVYLADLPRARAWMGLPLVDTEGEVIGMLSLTRERPAPYSQDEVSAGAAFAGQAGVALHNAHLYMELSLAYRQLSRLDRAKSDFIALASHELRTPLTLVTGYTQMLIEETNGSDNDSMEMIVDGLSEGTERLAGVVERIVDLAEIESQTLQLYFVTVPVELLVSEVVAEFRPALAQRQIRLHYADLDHSLDIQLDYVAIAKVFRHLIMNAIKFTPDGGEICISIAALPTGYEELVEPCVQFTVADTGIGIDGPHRTRVFEKFHQTGEISLHSSGSVKFLGGGPGLGLAIVKGIVEAHRGRVWVESPGRDTQACPGSRFQVVLPIHQPHATPELPGDTCSGIQPRSPRTS